MLIMACPNLIITAKAGLFTSAIWEALTSHLKVTKIYGAFHPQTYGTTEKQNRLQEVYLQMFGNY